MNMPVLETHRLILRPLQQNDLDDLYEYAQDPAVYQMGMWQPYASLDNCQKHLTHLMKLYEKGLKWWAMEHKADGKMIGRCEISDVDMEDKKAEIGYALNQSYWRRGLMHEALNSVLSYAFTTLQLNRIYAVTLTNNDAPYRLLERIGFLREGHLWEDTWVKGYPEDTYLYGLLKSNFASF